MSWLPGCKPLGMHFPGVKRVLIGIPRHRLTFSKCFTCMQNQLLKPKCHNLLVRHLSKRSNSELDQNIESSSSKRHLLITVLSGLGILMITKYYRQDRAMDKRSLENVINKNKNITKYTDPYCTGSSATIVQYDGFWLPQEFIKNDKRLEDIRKFRIREGDVIVASFPKSGTTWIQEIVHLILLDPDISSSGTSTIEERFPYLEYVYPGLRSLDARKGSRLLKTHLPYRHLPRDIFKGKGKVVYIVRNPKDVVVSYFHFVKLLNVTKYSGSFDDFYKSFKDGKVPYGPWNDHVLEYWVNREADNVLFITYEDLHKIPEESIRKIGMFLGKNLTKEQTKRIVQQTCFSRMKDNPLVNYSWWKDIGIIDDNNGRFMRKGIIGDWKNHLSKEMVIEMDNELSKVKLVYGLNLNDENHK